MKELSIEQKAKRYDKALDEAKAIHKSIKKDLRPVIEQIFPELKEPEDEKNIKDLIDELKCSLRAANCQNDACSGGQEKRIALLEWSIAWLKKQYNNANKVKQQQAIEIPFGTKDSELQEATYYIPDGYHAEINGNEVVIKQGEQKSVDKVEPKFEIGEWLCENEPNNYARFIHILEIVDVQGEERYRISRDIHNDEDIVDFDFVEKYYHNFDIKDAKDGDVLVSVSNYPFIYNGKFTERTVGAYCGFNVYGEFLVDKFPERCTWAYNKDIRPATKEQCDLLVARMKEEGYKWDADKKELIKL